MIPEENLNPEQLSVTTQERLDPATGEAASAQGHTISARKAAWGGVEITGAVLDLALLGFGLFLVYYMDYVIPQRDRGGGLILFAIPMVGAYLFSFLIALLLRKNHKDFSVVMMFLILIAFLFSFGFFEKL